MDRVVNRAVQYQHRRGPDAESIASFGCGGANVILGHNRLSIIDLTESANQPMWSSDHNLALVYNGEIYNYLELRKELEARGSIFATHSDSEVVLEAYRHWGDDAFNRFIGMFALAIVDKSRCEMVLARDRFGVKPLYYRQHGGTLAFASTPRPLAEWGGCTPNIDYVARGLRHKYYEDSSSISPYVGVEAVEPAHLIKVRADGKSLNLRRFRYYDLANRVYSRIESLASVTLAEAEGQLLDLLRSATQLRLRSDVPVGVSVSGGIDSSLIAALCADALPRVDAYSFGHPDATDSEGPQVAELASATGIHPNYIWYEPGTNVSDLFWRTLDAQDAPFPHASMMAQNAVFRRAKEHGTTVVLGGQGGDEGFMGYRKFFLFHLQSILRQRDFLAIPGFLSATLPLLLPVLRRGSVFWAERRRYSGAKHGMTPRIDVPTVDLTGASLQAGQSIIDRQILDITTFSIPTLLRYEDRNSMGNSIESRLPFMDHRVIEFGIALPQRLKLSRGYGKYVLRRAARGLVPSTILNNRDKRGFDVNQQRWIQDGLGRTIRQALEDKRAAVSEFLPSGETIDSLFSDQHLQHDRRAFPEAMSLIWMTRGGV